MFHSHFKLLYLPIALTVIALMGCSNPGKIVSAIPQGTGMAKLMIMAAANSPFQKIAKKATLAISASDMLTMSKNLTITDSSVEGTIAGIPAGKSRLFAVAVYDSLDTLQYRGSANANVIADSTVKVTINVLRVSGSAVIVGNIIDTNTVTVTDIDGNIYHTVSIGTQVWMVENLKTTKYKDGTAIPLVTANSAWAALTTPGYCWSNNDSATYKSIYGAIYNWYAVNTGKLAPTGWHVPTDSEWSVLTAYLGGDSVAGGKLKEVGTTHWATPNNGATNASGFSALPGGWRGGTSGSGAFYGVGIEGYWWSSTTYNTSNSWMRAMFNNSANVSRTNNINFDGFSVRCIKN
jgi:uncharacterized protein (TIGR02145 family)